MLKIPNIFLLLILIILRITAPVPAFSQEEKEDTGESIESVKVDENALNSPEGLDKIIDAKINDDIWNSLKGDLPCVNSENTCINELQNLAVNNNFSVRTISEKIEEVTNKIEEARSNNKQSVLWTQLSPFIQFYLTKDAAYSTVDNVPKTPGPIERILGDIGNPLRLINNILSLVGVPFLQNKFGGSAEVQQRAIAIGDLEIKVAELKRSQTELKQKIREQVTIELLSLDDFSREFQVSQEIGKRDQQRLEIMTVSYRFGEGNTESYLMQLNQFDRTKAQVYKNWAKMRSQIVRLQQLVFDQEEF
jgi:predicted lipoprotein